VTLIAKGGKRIGVHSIVLAAQSPPLYERLVAGEREIALDHQPKVVEAYAKLLYLAGSPAYEALGPCEALDLLALSQETGVTALEQEHVEALIHPPPPPRRGKKAGAPAPSSCSSEKGVPGERAVPKAAAPGQSPGPTLKDSIDALMHEGLQKHPKLLAGVCDNVGRQLPRALELDEDRLRTVPGNVLIPVLQSSCRVVYREEDIRRILGFCLEYCQLDSLCDLLRETKQWSWGDGAACPLRCPSEPETGEAFEWRLQGVHNALEDVPSRVVGGEFFEWKFRLDYGSEGKLRIVYEGATPLEDDGPGAPRCHEFPAATFAWRVLHRGQDVFNEKPVFICFPRSVPLHWSTTLPISHTDLTNDDSLTIMVNVSENPMLSLILSYFSMDLKSTLHSEDILNRLPHIEYRCLSSYMLVTGQG